MDRLDSLLHQRLERQRPGRSCLRRGYLLLSLLIPERLYRSDFFPGLGWMLTRTLWQELGASWPPAYWDDWLRHPDRRQGRACIRPEVSVNGDDDE